MPDFIEAHKFSSNHKDQLLKDSKCGCFYCLRIFKPDEIKVWVKDISGTATCPYCGVNSIIGESSNQLITKEFLEKMHSHWF